MVSGLTTSMAAPVQATIGTPRMTSATLPMLSVGSPMIRPRSQMLSGGSPMTSPRPPFIGSVLTYNKTSMAEIGTGIPSTTTKAPQAVTGSVPMTTMKLPVVEYRQPARKLDTLVETLVDGISPKLETLVETLVHGILDTSVEPIVDTIVQQKPVYQTNAAAPMDLVAMGLVVSERAITIKELSAIDRYRASYSVLPKVEYDQQEPVGACIQSAKRVEAVQQSPQYIQGASVMTEHGTVTRQPFRDEVVTATATVDGFQQGLIDAYIQSIDQTVSSELDGDIESIEDVTLGSAPWPVTTPMAAEQQGSISTSAYIQSTDSYHVTAANQQAVGTLVQQEAMKGYVQEAPQCIQAAPAVTGYVTTAPQTLFGSPPLSARRPMTTMISPQWQISTAMGVASRPVSRQTSTAMDVASRAVSRQNSAAVPVASRQVSARVANTSFVAPHQQEQQPQQQQQISTVMDPGSVPLSARGLTTTMMAPQRQFSTGRAAMSTVTAPQPLTGGSPVTTSRTPFIGSVLTYETSMAEIGTGIPPTTMRAPQAVTGSVPMTTAKTPFIGSVLTYETSLYE